MLSGMKQNLLIGLWLILSMVSVFAQDEALIGNYQLDNNQTISIAKFEFSTDFKPLIFTNFTTGRLGIITSDGSDKFVSGVGLLVNEPIDVRINFTRNKDGKVAGVSYQEGTSSTINGKKIEHKSKEINIQNGEAKLSGTLLIPNSKGKHPAIILLHGSGSLSRTSFGPFPYFFLSQGFAVLIYDKRGAGLSEPKDKRATLAEMRSDAIAGINFLKKRKDISKIGLWGTSQGGYLAGLVASKNKDVGFVINQSGMAVTAAEQDVYRVQSEMKADNFTDTEIAEAVEFTKLQLEVGSTGENWQELEKLSQKYKDRSWLDYVYTPASLNEVKKVWQTDFGIDATNSYKDVKCPVLALFGGLDTSTPVDATIANIKKNLINNKNLQIVTFPKANHSFLEGETGGKSELPKTKRFVPDLFVEMEKWLRKFK
ncbi:MAG: alpha/beta fold hydrolase [Acidobacteria bacterium]|nr:alpha/beta fold hydrolase [Acidobacteriota bacterium]